MARCKPTKNRPAIAQCRDPLAEKRRSRKQTVAQAAPKTCTALRPRRGTDKHAVWWMQTSKSHAFSILGRMSVDRIGRENVLRLLTPIRGTRPESTQRVRHRIRATLRSCWAQSYPTESVATERIGGALPRMPAVKAPLRTLPYREVAEALDSVESPPAPFVSKLYLRFLVLTTARSGEARGSTWDGISLDPWARRIPSSPLSTDTDHRVPLSPPAIEVLYKARAFDDCTGLIFPTPRRKGKEPSDMTLTKAVRSLPLAGRTVHGSSSTVTTWAPHRSTRLTNRFSKELRKWKTN